MYRWRAPLEYFEGGDLDTYRQGIKVSPTPSCNHKLVSQVPLDYLSLQGEDTVLDARARRWPRKSVLYEILLFWTKSLPVFFMPDDCF